MTMSGEGKPKVRPPGPLPKRFYTSVSVVAAEGKAAGFRVLLDGKPVRTPAKAEFVVPTAALAEAIAAEWEAQRAHIDPATMPLTRLANSAIDGVRTRVAEVRAEVVKYAGSDLLCYRAESPGELVRRQAEAWDPILAWVQEALHVRFVVGQGIVPLSQAGTALAAIVRALERLDDFTLSAVHVMTTLTGSALLALAHAHGRLSAEAAWAAAHVDEDWQIAQWGEDAEAKARRVRRWVEMQAASRLMHLVRDR
ncbi:MAG: ATPase [Hyphomicrobiaceae bacterium]|nr:MAG: ATPase [Hyphomicrobiaceae bacterium]